MLTERVFDGTQANVRRPELYLYRASIMERVIRPGPATTNKTRVGGGRVVWGGAISINATPINHFKPGSEGLAATMSNHNGNRTRRDCGKNQCLAKIFLFQKFSFNL